jgi:hypothetical protein
MTKILRGSALIDDEGGVLFTPYNSNPQENTPWVVLTKTAGGVLKCTRRKVCLTVTLERDKLDLGAMISTLNRESALLVASLLKGGVRRKMEKLAMGV